MPRPSYAKLLKEGAMRISVRYAIIPGKKRSGEIARLVVGCAPPNCIEKSKASKGGNNKAVATNPLRKRYRNSFSSTAATVAGKSRSSGPAGARTANTDFDATRAGATVALNPSARD